MKKYYLIILLLLTISCGPYLGKAVITVPFAADEDSQFVSVIDNRGIEGIEVSGVMNTQQPHRIVTSPTVSEAVRRSVSHGVGQLNEGDSITITILKNSCMVAHRLHEADTSYSFQAEAQYNVRGKVYTKMLTAGYVDDSVSAGMGLDPSGVCSRYFERVLGDIGIQASSFYEEVK